MAASAGSQALAAATAVPAFFAHGSSKITQSLAESLKIGNWKSKSDVTIDTYRVLIQTKKGSQQLFIRSNPGKKDKLKGLRVACATQGILPELQELKLKLVLRQTFPEELVKLERSFLDHDEYKFGVLYGKKDQSENQMFANVESSPNFERFLNLLGQRIQLKGWTRYAGGLDVRQDTTGKESVFREFRNLEVMFHVSTLLPYYPDDEQQVERKRHLGNDMVVIIFMENGAFIPSMIKTQFNHIYAVVSVVPEQEEDPPTDKSSNNNNNNNNANETAGESVPLNNNNNNGDNNPNNASTETSSLPPRVRVEFAAREGVRPYGPRLPIAPCFRLDEHFIDFLLTKLVNGQRAALHAPVFAKKLQHTRAALLEDLLKNLD